MTKIVLEAVRDAETTRFTVRELAVMLALQERAKWDFGDLVRHLQIPAKGALSRAVTTLCKAGLAARKANPKDRRLVWIESTPNGDALMQTLLHRTKGRAL